MDHRDADPAPQLEEAPDENPVAAMVEEEDTKAPAQAKAGPDSKGTRFPQVPEGVPDYRPELAAYYPGRTPAIFVHPDRVDFKVNVGGHRGIEKVDEYQNPFTPGHSFALSHALRTWFKHRPGEIPLVFVNSGTYAPLEIGGGNQWRSAYSPHGNRVGAWLRTSRRRPATIRGVHVHGNRGGVDGFALEEFDLTNPGTSRYRYEVALGHTHGRVALLNCEFDSEDWSAWGGGSGKVGGAMSSVRLHGSCSPIIVGCDLGSATEHGIYDQNIGVDGRDCWYVENRTEHTGRTSVQVTSRAMQANSKGQIFGGPPGTGNLYLTGHWAELVDVSGGGGSAITVAGFGGKLIHIEDVYIGDGDAGALAVWGSAGHGIHSYSGGQYLGAFGSGMVWTPEVASKMACTPQNAAADPDGSLIASMRDQGFHTQRLVVKGFESYMPAGARLQAAVSGVELFEHQGIDIKNGDALRLDVKPYGGPQRNGKVVDLGSINPTTK